MNFEKVNVLSQKIEGVLSTVRTLKEENQSLKQQLAASKASDQDKSMLLEKANENLAACQAALNEEQNQIQSRTQSLNTKDLEIEDLKAKLGEKDEKLQQCVGLLQQSADRIKEYEAKCAESAEALQACQAQVQEGESKVLNLSEENGSLKSELEEKIGLIESLNAQLQAQADEIAEAQEKFSQLVATIETELGTDLTLEQTEEPVERESLEEDLVEQETAEEDVPVIEVHPADEKEEDVKGPSASYGGSQTNFFG